MKPKTPVDPLMRGARHGEQVEVVTVEEWERRLPTLEFRLEDGKLVATPVARVTRDAPP